MSETLAKDWWQSRNAGKRLPEHEFVTCELCGEPSNEPVCTGCLEHQIEELIYVRTCETH
jgi:hypothetical protein